MFEKFTQLAETAATHVSLSRRGFLARLGHGALGAAGVVGGLLALSNRAQAGQHDLYSCVYEPNNKKCQYAFCGTVLSCGGCGGGGNCCKLVSKTIVGTC